MSRTWKKHNHHYSSLISEKKNKRLRYNVYHKFHFRYIQVHRAFSALKYNSEEPGIRTRLLPPDPWEDINIHHSGYLKPLRHSRLERHRAARKAAVREMDARLYGFDCSD